MARLGSLAGAVAVGLVVGCGPKAKLDSSPDALGFAADSTTLIAGSSKGSALVIDPKGKVSNLPVRDVSRWTLSTDGATAIGAVDQGFVVVDLATEGVETIAVPDQDGEPWQLYRTPFGDVALTKMVAHWRVHRWIDGNTKDDAPLSYKTLQGMWVDPAGEVFFVDTGFGLEVRDVRTGSLIRAVDRRSDSQRYVDAMLDGEDRIIAALWDDDGFQLWAPPDPPAGLWNLAENAPFDLAGNASVAAVATADGIELRNVNGQVQQLVTTKSRVVRVALSKDGTRVAGALQDGSIVVDDVDVPSTSVTQRPADEMDPGRIDLGRLAAGGEAAAPTAVHDLGQPPRDMQWSPGGKLQGWIGSDLVSVDPLTGEVRDVELRKLAPGRPFAWSADETTLAVMEDDSVVLYAPGRRRFMQLTRMRSGGGHSFMGLGAATLVVDVDATKVQAWSTETGEPMGEPFQVAGQVITGFSVSPDGTRMVTVGDDPTIYDTAAGKRVTTLRGHLSRVAGVAWSPDGKQVATVGNDGLLYLWDAEAGVPVRKIEGVLGQSLSYSPDGGRLLVAGATEARVFDVATGDERMVLTFQGTLTSADWGTLGMVLATNAGVLYVWL